MSRKMFRFVLGLALLVGTSDLMALTLKYVSLEELSREAPIIIHGTVQKCEGKIINNEIWTHCKVNVQEVIKGNASTTLCVKQRGGMVEGRGIRIPGLAVLKESGETILFLSELDSEGCSSVRGSNQGFYQVKDGIVEVKSEKGALIIDSPPNQSPSNVPIKQFIEQIRSYTQGSTQ